MNRLLFIFIFLLIWNEAAQTTMVNMNNTSLESEKIPVESVKIKIISPDLTKKVHNKTLAVCNNNPGNLRSFKTGEFREFNTLEEGYAALIYDLNLKISGKSIWTDSATTIYEFINIYAPSFENDVNTYVEVFCSETGLQASDLLNEQQAEHIARGIIRMEDSYLYQNFYLSQNDF